MTTASPSARSRAIAARDDCAQRIGDRDQSRERAIRGDEDDRLPACPRARARARRAAPCSRTSSRMSAAFPTASATPSTDARHSSPNDEFDRLDRLPSRAPSPAPPARSTRPADARCATRVRPRARAARRRCAREPGATTMSVTAGAPSVIVPVLSSTTVVTSPVRCSASPPLISTPDLRAAPRRDHHGGGNREPHGAWTGDDEHRHRGGEGAHGGGSPAATRAVHAR